MARKFDIPEYYRSPIISSIKRARTGLDNRKRDLSPSILDLGKVKFKIARHFGFCFGVENAIEIAYRAVRENPGKQVYLLSEMIHNPQVNRDLESYGVRFILAPDGRTLVPFENLRPEDIVIVPAFGTTTELFERLEKIGVNPFLYNATCPFVEKVWKRARQLGEGGFTVVVHGKETHEETRATFSHAVLSSPTLVIRDIPEARLLSSYITGERDCEHFETDFGGRYSDGFEAQRDLQKLGVVNQTTMLASETEKISQILKESMQIRFGPENIHFHFANTKDTLCYATYENQNAVYGLIEAGADLALIVGGYNSSNTSHLVELCRKRLPAFHIKDAGEIEGLERIRHLDFDLGEVVETEDWAPRNKVPVEMLITAGASCPDKLVDEVIVKIAALFEVQDQIEEVLASFPGSVVG